VSRWGDSRQEVSGWDGGKMIERRIRGIQFSTNIDKISKEFTTLSGKYPKSLKWLTGK